MPSRHPALLASLGTFALLGLMGCGAADDESVPADFDSVEGEEADPENLAEEAEELPDREAYQGPEEEIDKSEVTLATATSEEYGEYLVDGEGLALYVFVNDPPGESTCTDSCIEQWPILSSIDDPQYGPEIVEDLVGTIQRPNPAEADLEQVTYRDKPLYYYVQDQDPGQVNGQGVDDSWFLIGPDGVEIRESSASG